MLTRAIKLNSNDYWNTDSSWWNNTSPSSSAFTCGSSTATNGDGINYIAYCFASKSWIFKNLECTQVMGQVLHHHLYIQDLNHLL